MARKTRVIVVDDSALVRGLLTEIINKQSDMECIGAAHDPLIAREMIRNLNPDVITLDIEMPRMDGLDFLERLMRLRPMPVVMISTVTERGAEATIRALELGAIDFVSKPRLGISQGLQDLAKQIVDKIRVAAVSRVRRHLVANASAVHLLPPLAQSNVLYAPSPSPTLASGGIRASAVRSTSRSVPPLGYLSSEKLICIGASTGGTEAVREVLEGMPADAPAIAITQHMPPGFTASFAARLDGLCQITVKEAENGERLLPGHAYIAPGGKQFSIGRSGANYIACVDDSPPVNRHKPSVEVLFQSAAAVVGRNAYGVMLTGMGSDGAVAMRAMKDAGSYNLVQNEATCIVFGMPREAIAHGAEHEVLPLNEIGPALLAQLRHTTTHMHRI